MARPATPGGEPGHTVAMGVAGEPTASNKAEDQFPAALRSNSNIFVGCLATMLCGIADVYDAMRSQRVYQQAFPSDRILAVLGRLVRERRASSRRG